MRRHTGNNANPGKTKNKRKRTRKRNERNRTRKLEPYIRTTKTSQGIRENAKGTLRYEQETQTWQCAQCGRKYAAADARGATTHVEAHTGANEKKRRQREQQVLQYHAHRNADEVRIRTLLQYGQEKRGIPPTKHWDPKQHWGSTRDANERRSITTEGGKETEQRRSRPRLTDDEQETPTKPRKQDHDKAQKLNSRSKPIQDTNSSHDQDQDQDQQSKQKQSQSQDHNQKRSKTRPKKAT